MALLPATLSTIAIDRSVHVPEWMLHEEAGRLRRLRGLLALFALYAAALLAVTLLSDGADVGCVLAGISGHVMYATLRLVAEWRDAAWLDHARRRLYACAA
ncbi:MAG TPA: hypothetical protein VIF62_30295 [Labilithrix sp.]|jgi:hypothetical protein